MSSVRERPVGFWLNLVGWLLISFFLGYSLTLDSYVIKSIAVIIWLLSSFAVFDMLRRVYGAKKS